MKYIETSVGRIEFESNLDEHCIVTKYNGENLTIGIDPKDFVLYDKFLDLYAFALMKVVNTSNGPFLTIELDDPYYGDPEYKIYEVQN